jgi:hypothetical protein
MFYYSSRSQRAVYVQNVPLVRGCRRTLILAKYGKLLERKVVENHAFPISNTGFFFYLRRAVTALHNNSKKLRRCCHTDMPVYTGKFCVRTLRLGPCLCSVLRQHHENYRLFLFKKLGTEVYKKAVRHVERDGFYKNVPLGERTLDKLLIFLFRILGTGYPKTYTTTHRKNGLNTGVLKVALPRIYSSSVHSSISFKIYQQYNTK